MLLLYLMLISFLVLFVLDFGCIHFVEILHMLHLDRVLVSQVPRQTSWMYPDIARVKWAFHFVFDVLLVLFAVIPAQIL